MPPIDPPTLRDGALTLRQGRPEDVDAVTAACQDPEIPRYGEIGYWVAAEARGRGIATRATRLLHDWSTRELGLTTLEILPHRDNAPSRRVAERCGYSPTGELRRAPRADDPEEPAYVVYAWQA